MNMNFNNEVPKEASGTEIDLCRLTEKERRNLLYQLQSYYLIPYIFYKEHMEELTGEKISEDCFDDFLNHCYKCGIDYSDDAIEFWEGYKERYNYKDHDFYELDNEEEE